MSDMTLKSMTGYGRGTASAQGIKVDIELSSVNRKQFDVRLSLPRATAALEARLIETIQETVKRGYITGTVTVHASERARAKGISVNRILAMSYLDEIRTVSRRLDLPDDLSSSSLLHLPEVVQYHYPVEDVDLIWPLAAKALWQALQMMLKMRQREGRILAADLSGRLSRLLRLVLRIEKAAPCVMEKYRRSLAKRVQSAELMTRNTDPQVLKEIVLFAGRSDITEELTRLRSHLCQARRLLFQSQPVGRTLDFLTQELLREMNTIGAKANDAAIAGIVIQCKTELERIREQAQNVE
jgi:uncharacterized protein (TIGR00255 family)